MRLPIGSYLSVNAMGVRSPWQDGRTRWAEPNQYNGAATLPWRKDDSDRVVSQKAPMLACFNGAGSQRTVVLYMLIGVMWVHQVTI